MPTFTDDPVISRTSTAHAIEGESVGGRGVVGRSEKDYGIRAHSKKSSGIRASSDEGVGVEGWATNNDGVVGISKTGIGVRGQVEGTGIGVAGISPGAAGVRGTSVKGTGTEGFSTEGVGVFGTSEKGAGVWGQVDSAGTGVQGTSKLGIGVFGKGGRLAGLFQGDVEVTGDIRLVQADCAEDFDIEEAVDPGTVMVLGAEGVLRQSHQAYDKRVAGVISGAGNYRPGIVLDKQESQARRLPIGLLGKVYCKVDAQSSPIEIGDLLTTSSTPGHAMKAIDPLKAFGSVIGKALRPLKEGQGLIPILVALQ